MTMITKIFSTIHKFIAKRSSASEAENESQEPRKDPMDTLERYRSVVYKLASHQIFGREINPWPDREIRVALLKQWAEEYYVQTPDFFEDPSEAESQSIYVALHKRIKKEIVMDEVYLVSIALLSFGYLEAVPNLVQIRTNLSPHQITFFSAHPNILYLIPFPPEIAPYLHKRGGADIIVTWVKENRDRLRWSEEAERFLLDALDQ